MSAQHGAFLEPSRVVLLFLQDKKRDINPPLLSALGRWLEIVKSLMSLRVANLERHSPWLAVLTDFRGNCAFSMAVSNTAMEIMGIFWQLSLLDVCTAQQKMNHPKMRISAAALW